MNIQKIEFNCLGEVCSYYEIGKYGVSKILNHPAQGEGDKFYWTVVFEDGREEMVFNPNRVFLTPSTFNG